MSQELIEQAIELARATPGMSIHGKRYTQVKERIEIFRKVWGHGYSIETQVLTLPPYKRGDHVLFKATICDVGSGKVVADGHACEVVGATEVNQVSFVEAGETSAIGRALASFGLHGGEYASFDEMERVPIKEEAAKVDAGREFDALRIPEINVTNDALPALTGGDLDTVRESFRRSLAICHSEQDLLDFWVKNENTLNMLDTESESSHKSYEEIQKLFKTRRYALQKEIA